MSDELLINATPGEIRAAVVSDGLLTELFVERRSRESLVGNIYHGRVERVLPGMDAAFIDIGIGRSGFMGLEGARIEGGRGDDVEGGISALLTEGQLVTAQVTKDAIGRKGAQLTRRLALPGRYLVYTPSQARVAVSRQIDEDEKSRLAGIVEGLAGAEEGFIVRTAAAGAEEAELSGDADYLRALWLDIEARRDQSQGPGLLRAELDPLLRLFRDHVSNDIGAIRLDSPGGLAAAREFCARFMPELEPRLQLHDDREAIFELHDVEGEIERACGARVSLASGAVIVVETTEALTAIDVNSASYTGRSHLEDTAFATNMEAAAEIVRQIRLRNIGGLIVIDFIHMAEDARWAEVVGALEAGFAGDRTHTRVMGRTAANLVEITRRRRRESLSEMTTEICACCAGLGRIVTAETVAFDTMRALGREARAAAPGSLVVTACDDVIDVLEQDASRAFGELTAALGRRVLLRRDPDMDEDAFDISVDG